MDEILRSLTNGSRVLDLGSGAGSFDAASTKATVVRLDQELRCTGLAVRGDASRLPFEHATFDAVIANHTLEHFEDLSCALAEIGRVVKPDGALFVSVPDASTICDRIYRWLSRGGGHVNPFSSAEELANRIETATGMKHVATRTLHSSLCYLNRRNARTRLPLRLWLFGGGHETPLVLWAWLSRFIDRKFHRRWSVYGWAFYFGAVPEPILAMAWINVCLRCGSGAPSSLLEESCLLPKRRLLPPRYRCPACGAVNPFARDK